MYLCNLFFNILLFTYVKRVENMLKTSVFICKTNTFKAFYMVCKVLFF